MIKYLAILTLLLASVVSIADFKLAENGKTTASIVLAKDASPPEQLAKRELNAYLKKVVGDEAATESERRIIIGTVNDTPELDAANKDRLEKAERDAFNIRITDDKVLIIGKDPRSALFGTYEFIEKYLGVRWFYPGEMGEHAPKKTTISLPEGNDFQQADYKYRTLNVCCGSRDFVGTYDWMTRGKMRNNCAEWQLNDYYLKRFTPEERKTYLREHGSFKRAGGHHGFRRAVPASLLEAHPEYFALKKGKRVATGRINRCLSNKQVQDMVTSDYLKAYQADPENTTVCFMGEDSQDAFCDCPNCVAMGTYEGKYGIPVYFHRFFKLVGDRILRECPDANLLFSAYWNYRAVPEDPTITYRSKNSSVLYCTHQKCYAHDFAPDVPCNRGLYQQLQAWKRRADKIFIFDYRHDSRCFYAPFEFVLANDLKTFKKLGVVGWLDEVVSANQPLEAHVGKDGKYRFISAWQTHYVAAKLLWDTSLDVDEILDEAYDLYYGKAATVMKQYHAYRRVLWDSAPGHCLLNGPVRTAYCLNVPGAEIKLRDYLDRAVDLADSEMARKRVEQDRLFLDVFWKKPSETLKQALRQKKELISRKTEDAIVIDGKFDERTWVKAQPVDGFLTNKKEPAKANTKVRIAHDADNLYIAVNASDANAALPATADVEERDGNVWNDDSIEIQLAPPNADGKYYHLILNTKGVLYDASCLGQNFDRSYDSKLECKVVKDGDVYKYEIRIPLAPMKSTLKPGETWKAHFLRNVTNLVPPTNREWSSVDGVKPFALELFRKLSFGRNYIVNGNFAEMNEKYEVKPGLTLKFPTKWGLSGTAIDHHKVIETEAGNHIWVNGVLYQTIRVPKNIPEGDYVFTVRAKGSGKIVCRNWSYERGENPGEAKNHRRDLVGEDVLSDEFKDYSFKYPFLPSEDVFTLYIYGKDITIESVSCAITGK